MVLCGNVSGAEVCQQTGLSRGVLRETWRSPVPDGSPSGPCLPTKIPVLRTSWLCTRALFSLGCKWYLSENSESACPAVGKKDGTGEAWACAVGRAGGPVSSFAAEWTGLRGAGL